jgi:hypothetical protein
MITFTSYCMLLLYMNVVSKLPDVLLSAIGNGSIRIQSPFKVRGAAQQCGFAGPSLWLELSSTDRGLAGLIIAALSKLTKIANFENEFLSRLRYSRS